MQTCPPPTPPALDPPTPRPASGSSGLGTQRGRPLGFAIPPRAPGAAPSGPSDAEPSASACPACLHARRLAGKGRAGPGAGGGTGEQRVGGGRGRRRGPGRRRGRGFLCLQPAARAPAPSPPRAPLGARVWARGPGGAGGARSRVRARPDPDPQVRAGPSVVAAPGPVSRALPGGERGPRARRARAPSPLTPRLVRGPWDSSLSAPPVTPTPLPPRGARAVPAHSFHKLLGAVLRRKVEG